MSDVGCGTPRVYGNGLYPKNGTSGFMMLVFFSLKHIINLQNCSFSWTCSSKIVYASFYWDLFFCIKMFKQKNMYSLQPIIKVCAI